MNEERNLTSPPKTLIGLGPPEAPRDAADGAEAPETLRPWATSADHRDDLGPDFDVPPAPPVPRGLWQRPSGEALDALPFDGAARGPALLIAVGALSLAVSAFAGVFFRNPPAASPHAAAAGHAPAVMPAVPAPVAEAAPLPSPSVESPVAPPVPETKAHVHKRRAALRVVESAPQESEAPAEPSSSRASPASDRQRVSAIASAVKLEDDEPPPAPPTE